MCWCCVRVNLVAFLSPLPCKVAFACNISVGLEEAWSPGRPSKRARSRPGRGCASIPVLAVKVQCTGPGWQQSKSKLPQRAAHGPRLAAVEPHHSFPFLLHRFGGADTRVEQRLTAHHGVNERRDTGFSKKMKRVSDTQLQRKTPRA